MTADINLNDKVALVTGGAAGIGKAIVQQLLRYGAKVVVNDVNEEMAAQTIAELRGDAKVVVADVSQESDVVHLIEQTINNWGRLDIVVNNAAIAMPASTTLRQELVDWQKVINVNLRGTFLVSREAGRILTKQESGSIINIASLAGLGAIPASNDYGVSKAGVVMMTQTMASEWGCYGVRVNAIAPGFTDAPMLERILTGTKVQADYYLRRIPLGRLAKADDIANLVVFLASSMASYITGAVIPVDGGWLANAGP